MDIDPELIKQLVQTFQVELDEQLQSITDSLLTLEKEQLTAELRQQILESAFRAAHNIKGAARGVEVLDIADIAHHLETLLSGLKQAGEQPGKAQIDLSLEALDQMRECMQAFQDGRVVSYDLAGLNRRLEQAAMRGTGSAGGELPGETAKRQEAGLQERENDSPQAQDKESGGLAPAGVDTATGGQSTMQKTMTDSIRVAADRLDQVGALVEELQITKIEVEDHFSAIRDLCERVDNLDRIWSRTVRQVKSTELDALPVNIRQLFTTSADTVAGLNETTQQVYRQIRGTSTRLGFTTKALQADIRTLRMVPASTLIRPLARTVRNLASELGKDAQLDIVGDDLEIDRIILQGISDPLVHLLRNSIDHGLESASERAAAGKPGKGRISITLHNDGSHAVITVEDDGGGIDVNRVANVAIDKGLMTSKEARKLSEQELLEYIFRPGFSTKGIITDVSGRGVGLDVVQTNLRALKGLLAVTTTPGKGTTFTLRLPFTLSAEFGLIIQAGGKRFAIPVTSLERVMEIPQEEVVDVEASQAIIIDGQPVPLRDMASVLGVGQTRPESSEGIAVIVVSTGRRMVALAVDEIEGEREIVIKPLRPPLLSVNNIAGATVTGSGEVIMVLNSSDLVESALNTGHKLQTSLTRQGAGARKQPRILVVDDSITTRTLERNILEARGYAVTVAIDGKAGWEALQTMDFDLVITDIEMPVMNGFDLTRRIKQSEKHRDIPVIIVTSLGSEEDRQRGIDVGADGYIVKSQFETIALLDTVRQLL